MIRYSLILILLVVCNQGFASDFKTLSMRVTKPGTKVALTVTTVQVPEASEQQLVENLVRQADAGGSDPIVIVYKEGDRFSKFLAKLPADHPRIRAIALKDEDLQATSRPREHYKTGRAMASLSYDELTRAGTLVAITGTGLFSSMFYFTSDIGSATAATLMTAAFQVLNFKYPELLWNYLHRSGSIFQRTVGRVLPSHQRAHQAAYHTGKVQAAFIYNFLTQAAFVFAINLGDFQNSLNNADVLRDIATVAATGILTSSSWELFFSKLNERSDDQEMKKLTLLMKYEKQLFMMALSPFYYIPQTQEAALAVSVAFGSLGVSANFFEKPFLHAADRMMSLLTKPKWVSSGVAKILNLSKLNSKIQFFPKNGRSTCENNLVESP